MSWNVYPARKGINMRFKDMLRGICPDRAPVVAKIWLDWAVQHGYARADEAIGNPGVAMQAVVNACMDMEMDAARLFLMPPRPAQWRSDVLWQVDADGKPLGRVDLNGGWATMLERGEDFNIESPEITMNIQSYAADEPPVREASDARRIAVPDADWYDARGYGQMVARAALLAGGNMDLVGDCNGGTLSFYIGLRGMTRALTDLFDDPDMVHACMEKGVEICLERARFFLRHGVNVLRYNDSSANMMLVSPGMWRQFVFPHLKRFCDEVHALSTETRIYCHMCGDILPVIGDIRAAGIDMIGPLDPLSGHSVAEFRKAAGSDALLMGGVNTLTLLNGSKEEVSREARACLRDGGAGFALGSGCAVARDTPPENLRALVETARKT